MTDPTNEPEQALPPPASPYAAPPPGAPPAPAIPPGYGYAPPVPAGMYYDPASGVVLPNGVVLASVGRRIGAYFLAFLLVIVTLVIGYVVWGLIVWGRGTSPALQVLGMRVWKPATNEVAGFGTMALRDILGRIVEGILGAISLLVSFILFCANKDHKALHDMIASTVVVHDPNGVIPT